MFYDKKLTQSKVGFLCSIRTRKYFEVVINPQLKENVSSASILARIESNLFFGRKAKPILRFAVNCFKDNAQEIAYPKPERIED